MYVKPMDTDWIHWANVEPVQPMAKPDPDQEPEPDEPLQFIAPSIRNGAHSSRYPRRVDGVMSKSKEDVQ